MNAPIIILATLSRYRRIFREAGATNPAAAILPPKYGIPDSFLFRKLVRQGVLVHVGDGIYYMDENRETEVQNNKRKLIIIMLAIIAIGLVIGYFLPR
jgi:hypothetical protein